MSLIFLPNSTNIKLFTSKVLEFILHAEVAGFKPGF